MASTGIGLAFGIAATTGISLVSSKLESLDEVFDALATGDNAYNKVKLTYKYKAYNGNDGAYYLKSVTIY
jgi:hypothetical protein